MSNTDELVTILKNYRRRLKQERDRKLDEYMKTYANGRVEPNEPVDVSAELAQINEAIDATLKDQAVVEHFIDKYED